MTLLVFTLGAVGSPAVEAASQPASDAEAPRIALVFDDLGYSVEGLAHELLTLPAKVTFAILPGLKHSQAFAESARAYGHDVILHLPLEPLDPAEHDPGRDALWVDFKPEENRRRIRHQLDLLPSCMGVSNHMGSRFSADRESARLLMSELITQRPDLFFLDSKTTPHSLLAAEAVAAGMKAYTNDIFLEGVGHGVEGSAIQTRKLERIAKSRGQAIGIGHVGEATVAAVQRAVASWQAQGIQLVGLTDLRHRPRREGTR